MGRDSNEHLPFLGSDREDLEQLYLWTYDDAAFAQQQWMDKHALGPMVRGPISRWRDAQKLRELNELYKAGDQKAVLEAISICAYNSFPIPQWCAQAFMQAYVSVLMYEAKSWDDIFGKPHKKGTHIETRRQRLQDHGKIMRRINEIIETEPETAIDERLFEKVGRELGIGGKTTTADIYYNEKQWYDDFINDGPPLIVEPLE